MLKNNKMEASITTSKGVYYYQVKTFTLGTKRINREIAQKNLSLFRGCLEEAGIIFGFAYGTLLGAIREGNFIAHDEDIDVFVLEENRNKVLDILFELKKNGLMVGRYEEDLISFVKDDEYIDIYFFKKNIFGNRVANGSFIEAKYLEKLKQIEFLGELFFVPEDSKELLEKLYGKDWMTPRENVKGSNFGVYLTLRKLIGNYFPFFFRIISWSKKNVRI